MAQIKALAVQDSTAALQPWRIERRAVGPNDVQIDIAYCGICHSDVHQARNEWRGSLYPMVPGHEIVGRVSKVGASVKRFKVGAVAGVGCFVDSCRSCHACTHDQQQYCSTGMTATYNSVKAPGGTPTYGGYSAQMVVDENYALQISAGLDLHAVAPLLCAGITTYSPLARLGAGPHKRVGVMGLGGLGHMAVKIAAAMGSEVTVLSTSPGKQADAKRLGAHEFALTSGKDAQQLLQGRFDIIINTVSAPHDLNAALGYLGTFGTLVMLGVAPEGLPLNAFSLIGRGRSLTGSLIGGIKQTQEMLDFCAKKGLTADVEMCTAAQVNSAYERIVKNDVKYRFVIDMATL
jgi:uncharacterized zinc-type alcohol dehydrogenase-like protein